MLAFAFLGDLAKAMQTSLPRELPLKANLDLARVGLGAVPKALLLMGGGGPSNPSHASGEGLVISFFLGFSLFLFGVTDIC